MSQNPAPNRLPDLSLPERSEAAPLAPLPESSSSIAPAKTVITLDSKSWKVADRVLAPWEPMFLYPGSIAAISNNFATIEYDDGDEGQVPLSQLRPLVLPERQFVQARRPGKMNYFPGRIGQVRGDDVQVVVEDGSSLWLRVSDLRFPCQPSGPETKPVYVASHMEHDNDFRVGDKVWAHWSGGIYFVGVIDQISGRDLRIRFDDGDRGWVKWEQAVPFSLAPQMMVLARAGSQYVPAIVVEIVNDGVHVQYDNGQTAWCNTGALAMPGDARGPNARPTGLKYHMSWAWILIVIALVVIRGCAR